VVIELTSEELEILNDALGWLYEETPRDGDQERIMAVWDKIDSALKEAQHATT
jgi:hypothetical protein